jgi:UV DNA damage endonuclease
MKIGYPCINRTIGCHSDSTFRLKSYSEGRLVETVDNNLTCLQKILEFNVSRGILFFRITSDLVPFASHPVNKFDWARHFKQHFKRIGKYIQNNDIRISMHPDQFTLINAIDDRILSNSIAELNYHARILDLLGLDTSAKIQVHIGGVYGNKDESMKRFVDRYHKLPVPVKRRLVIENDDVSYTLSDCLNVHDKTGIPILFDVFHHSLNNSGQKDSEAIRLASATWHKKDGCLMIDYCEIHPGGSFKKARRTIT